MKWKNRRCQTLFVRASQLSCMRNLNCVVRQERNEDDGELEEKKRTTESRLEDWASRRGREKEGDRGQAPSTKQQLNPADSFHFPSSRNFPILFFLTRPHSCPFSNSMLQNVCTMLQSWSPGPINTTRAPAVGTAFVYFSGGAFPVEACTVDTALTTCPLPSNCFTVSEEGTANFSSLPLCYCLFKELSLTVTMTLGNWR